MKVSMYKSDLQVALKLVGKSVAVKSSTPILSGIYLAAEGSKLELQSNNLTTGTIAKIPVNVERDGATVIYGKKFIDIVAKLPDETMSLEVVGNELIITSGAAKFSLITFEESDYPKVKKPEGNELAINAALLKEIIGKTSNTIAKEDSRPIFTGVFFEFGDGGIKATSTDTHRLSHFKARNGCDFNGQAQVNIPAEALKNLATVLPSDQQEVRITVGDKAVAFVFDNYLVTTRLLESTFPPYNKLLAEPKDFSITVNRKELKKAVERVSLIARDSDYNALIFEIESKALTVSAKSEYSKAEECLEITGGEELTIGFKCRYVLDFLGSVSGENLEIEFGDKYSPSKWCEVGKDDFVGLITPVRTA